MMNIFHMFIFNNIKKDFILGGRKNQSFLFKTVNINFKL